MSDSNVVAISTLYQGSKTHVPAKIREFLNLKDGDTILYGQDYGGKIWISKGTKLSDLKLKKQGKYV